MDTIWSRFKRDPQYLAIEMASETSNKKLRGEKKERYCQEQGPDQNSRSPPTSVGMTNTLDRALKGGACNGGVRKDLSHITCFNCDKKCHYADKCPEPRKGRDVEEDEQLSRPCPRQ